MHGNERGTVVLLSQGLHDCVDGIEPIGHSAGGRDLVESRKGVASGTGSPMDGVVDGIIAYFQPGLLNHPASVVGQHVAVDEVELQVLGAAADGGHHLVGLGGAQHENHVVGGLLERFEEGVLRSSGEHVDLVEDIHLGFTGGAHRHPGDEVANIVHLVVGGGVELDEVVGGVIGDVLTGLALAARLAVAAQIGAVEGLGQYTGRAGLARAPGTAEQIGMADPALLDRVLEGENDGLLPPQLGKASRAGSVDRAPEGPLRRLYSG